MCPEEAAFQSSCLTAILDFQKVVEEIADQADHLGGRYATVEKVTAEVAEAINTWVDGCFTSTARTDERARCVITTWPQVLSGDAAILAAIYEVERP